MAGMLPIKIQVLGASRERYANINCRYIYILQMQFPIACIPLNSKYNTIIIPDTIIYNLICTYAHLRTH